MTALMLDTHVLYWARTEPARLSAPARAAITSANQLFVGAMTWYELAWLAENGRIEPTMGVRAWFGRLAESVETLAISPAIAATAAALTPPFPGDPADRLIYATAIETGYRLVTKDRLLRKYPQPRPITLW